MSLRPAAFPSRADTGPTSHTLRWEAGVVQSVAPPGTTDLGPGYLGPDLLPVGLLARAYTEAMADYGAAALAYGDDRGALALRTALAARTHRAGTCEGARTHQTDRISEGVRAHQTDGTSEGARAHQKDRTFDGAHAHQTDGTFGGAHAHQTDGTFGGAHAHQKDRTSDGARAHQKDGIHQGSRPGCAGGMSCGPEGVLVTAGTSQALHLLATTLARPGDAVLVEESCYDLGRLILTDCGLRPCEVPGDASGMDPGALDTALAVSRPAFVYLNPTFHNPTGRVVPLHRRHELLAVARRHATTIVEDDAYADLYLDGVAPPAALACLAGHRGVIRLGTFSKSLAPGLRLGWLTAEPALADRLAAHGVLQSGGCPNHTTSLAVSTLLDRGHYDRHLVWLRERLRERRDALVDVLAARLDAGFQLDRPVGGLFVWVRTDRREPDLLAAARRAGVLVSAGSRFGSGGSVPDSVGSGAAPGGVGSGGAISGGIGSGGATPGSFRSGGAAAPGLGSGPGGARAGAVRLAYSLNGPDELAAAAERLAAAWNAIPPDRRGPES
ncbi:aminotransferase class I/II-fold pyridoxal phosphate-dependent enzyme [Nonomuraea guangzhouensis]|uniref:Aminotransferase class I/II-fold pyridoxal phosphate-dependent enzyme n=1 Tax=Nonomuraea guangzhouensis TaxID=1291555 RepID=A0ABW4GC05_9ACTN|nr:aminotransferase class I/II-fold pyridoxal phosphate-dependent enzyme [Nonomuraea guangzhouensis]